MGGIDANMMMMMVVIRRPCQCCVFGVFGLDWIGCLVWVLRCLSVWRCFE